jgi:hypothetical protein
LSPHRQRFTAFAVELESHAIGIQRLMLGFTMFRFTGGCVPAESFCYDETNAYIAFAMAVDDIAPEVVERYRAALASVTAISLATQDGSTPRTLKRRLQITTGFSNATVECLRLNLRLQSSIQRLLL